MTEVQETRRTVDLRRSIKQCTECGQRFSAEAAFCPFDGTKLGASMWDPSKDPLVGQTIDARYEVESLLGEGGMGKVYRVRHVALDRAFAMKVLRKELARDDELGARFIQEAKTTASVRHPNIVSISDFGRLPDDTPYFVMELLIGKTLGEVIKLAGQLPAARAVKIVTQIAGALGAAHAAGIVHRDLKPENVFLIGGISAGEISDDLRIVDFGAAKVMGASRLTKTGIVFGTPHYMSPEQASGQAVDHRADIYALGIIMYEMFAGRVPFEADTYMGVLTQHMFVQPIPPSQVSAAAKELGALEEITLRALEKKPEDRYATMDELVTDIAAVARVHEGHFEVDAHLAGGGARASRPPRSLRYKMADELEPPTLEEMRLAIDSMAPPRNRLPWPFIAGGAALVAVVATAAIVWSREAPPSSSRAAVAATALASPVASAAAPVAPSAASAANKVVTVRATPPAQLVRIDGAAVIGSTPVSVTVDPSAPALVRYTLKAPGYVDQDLAIGPATAAEVDVTLQKVPAAAPVPPPVVTSRPGSRPPPPAPGPGDGLPDPFKHP